MVLLRTGRLITYDLWTSFLTVNPGTGQFDDDGADFFVPRRLFLRS